METESRTFPVEKCVRDLNQHPSAVSGLRIATAGASVHQVLEDLNALQDDIVRLLPLYIGDEANTAVIVLMLRMIESLRRGKPAEGIGLDFLVPVCHLPKPLKSSGTALFGAILTRSPRPTPPTLG